MDLWMRENPGRSMSILVILSIVSYAYLLAFIPSNIVAGFQKTGIYPFERNAITPNEYLQNYATCRTFSSEEMIQPQDAATMQNNSNSDIQTDITSQLVQQDIPTALHEKKQSLDDDDPSCSMSVLKVYDHWAIWRIDLRRHIHGLKQSLRHSLTHQ